MKKYFTGEVSSILEKIPIVKNLARKKFILLFTLSMIRSRSVQFCEIAEFLNDEVQTKSNEIRIQNFFRLAELHYDQIALLLAFFLPKRGKITLSIDRTEWDFGIYQANILMIVASCKDVSVPLYWELLDNNSGNSNTDDRIGLLKQCIKLLGAKRIGLFLGDREFIGHRWLKYLKDMKIHFCVRIPKHHKIIRFLEIDGVVEAEEILGDKDEVLLSNPEASGWWMVFGEMYI